MLRIFDRQEWLRVNRARARIKVLIDKIGIEAFREQVDEELEGDWVAERDFDSRTAALRRRRGGERPKAPLEAASPNGERSSSTASRGQRPGAAPAGLLGGRGEDQRGDLTPEQFRGLAAIMREFTGGYARSTVQQNLVLRWVHDEALFEVWQRLE